MNLSEIKNFLENLSLIQWLAITIFTGLAIFHRWLLNIVWLVRKEKRLLQNRKKPILLVKPTDKDFGKSSDDYGSTPTDMEREYELLSDSKFFKVNKPITADRITTKIGNHGLIILGYCKGMDCFKDVLDAAKHRQIPIIIYTFGDNRLSHEDLDEVKKYPWHSMSNFPIRLVSEVFTTLATFQYKKTNPKN